MNNEDLATYLVLSPEFGGTRFGPFQGLEITLGSDKSRCDITLSDSLGVLPEHVKVLRQPDMSMILAPLERTATVYLWQAKARRPSQVNTPTAVRSGDSFSIVTEDGPRFLLEVGPLPPEMLKARQDAKSIRAKRLTGKAFAAEGKRQVWTTILVTGPGQFVQRAFTFVKSGAIFQPRYIFLGIALLGGYVWGGTSSCSAKKTKVALTTSETSLTNCKKDLSFAENMGGAETANFAQLAGEIVDSTSVGRALEEDDALRTAVSQAAKTLLSQGSAYDWLIMAKDGRATRFATWRELLADEEGLDADIILVAPFIGAEAENTRSDWSKMEDSLTMDVCTRGTARMTFRQGLHLGLMVQPDGLVSKNLSDYQSDKVRREELLLATVQEAGVADLPETFESIVEPFGRGRYGCVYVEGEDDRGNDRKLVRALVKHLGEDSTNLPPLDSAHSVPARLAKFFAADLADMDFRDRDVELNFAVAPTGTVLAGLETKGQWVMRRTAEVLARAIVLPCEAALRNPGKETEQVFGHLPDVVPCLVLNYRLRNE